MGNTTDIDSKTGKNANDILLQVVGFFGYAISRPNECIQNGSVAWLPPSAEASPAKSAAIHTRTVRTIHTSV